MSAAVNQNLNLGSELGSFSLKGSIPFFVGG